MIRRHFEKLLVRPEDVAPSRDDFEVIGAFNPGAVAVGSQVVLLVRIAERPREVRAGRIALPRWTSDEGVVIDWVRDDEWGSVDPRVVRRREDGQIRLTFLSHLRVMRSRDGRAIDAIDEARFWPESRAEEFGVEDPRITSLDGRCWFTYVGASSEGVVTSLASTSDFVHFERHGCIFCPENKDVVLFPRRIGEHYVALHRPHGAAHFCRPQMWLARSGDLRHWGSHQCLAGGRSCWEADKIGGGPPPLETAGGWLTIYHGCAQPAVAGAVGAYSAGAMLLDLANPGKVLARAREPILVPSTDFERRGFVPEVFFPTGIIDRGDTLLVYYGAADTYTGVVEVAKQDVLASLER